MMLNTSSFFKKSPLNEVVCSIQYKSSDFSFIIEDEFYQSVKNVYPKVIDNSPLSPIFDKKSVEFFPDIQTEINRIPLIRHFFINELENKLIQFQDGRFIFNWRKIPEKEIQYPRFQTVFSEFKYYWEILVSIFEKRI
jgi:hypothetical protein